MAATLSDRFRRWFDYERDAHDKVMASLETVPESRRDSLEYRRALALVDHLVAARWIWLYRLGVMAEPPRSLFTEGPEIGSIAADWPRISDRWAAYLATADDATLAQVFEYQSYDGNRFRGRVEDILAHLFGHSSYHRGQIAMLVRAAGGQPAMTDFVYWSREPVLMG